MLTYTLDYLENCASVYERQRVIDSLTNLFSFIASEKIHPTLTKRFLDICFAAPDCLHPYNPPKFGKPKITHFSVDHPILNSEVEQQMCNQDNPKQITFKTILLNWDYSLQSDDMFKTLLTVADIQDEEFFKISLIINIVDYLWKKAKFQLFTIGIAFSILMLILSIYIGLGDRVLGLEICILILTTLFLLSECIQISTLGMKYITSVWNWIDLASLVLIIAFIITRLTNNEDETARGWLITGIIIGGYTRWVSYLRLFNPTSKHIYLSF